MCRVFRAVCLALLIAVFLLGTSVIAEASMSDFCDLSVKFYNMQEVGGVIYAIRNDDLVAYTDMNAPAEQLLHLPDLFNFSKENASYYYYQTYLTTDGEHLYLLCGTDGSLYRYADHALELITVIDLSMIGQKTMIGAYYTNILGTVIKDDLLYVNASGIGIYDSMTFFMTFSLTSGQVVSIQDASGIPTANDLVLCDGELKTLGQETPAIYTYVDETWVKSPEINIDIGTYEARGGMAYDSEHQTVYFVDGQSLYSAGKDDLTYRTGLPFEYYNVKGACIWKSYYVCLSSVTNQIYFYNIDQ